MPRPVPLVECVPNFSEGRDGDTIDALRSAITGVAGALLLDVHIDPSHHRSVFTFAAPPEAAVEAAFRAAAVARERIDLRRHRGVHMRIGATDVVPFVPLRGTTLDDCVALARHLGERIGRELEIPVYLYARAATRPERERLADLRRGGFEQLATRLNGDPAAAPDFGPRHPHPTAGATAVGARPVLVAYNVWLDTPDLEPARAIAREIRASSGGLPAVQAAGFTVAGRARGC
jgi:glutamate formiminotransferase